MFEDRRGTEINCGGLRETRGWRGTTGKREKDEEERERERERERGGERQSEWDSARMGLRLPWRPS